MPLPPFAKIMIGWTAAWVSGAATFQLLRMRVDSQRKERMKMRKLKRKERKQRQLDALGTQNLADSQVQTIGNGSS